MTTLTAQMAVVVGFISIQLPLGWYVYFRYWRHKERHASQGQILLLLYMLILSALIMGTGMEDLGKNIALGALSCLLVKVGSRQHSTTHIGGLADAC